MCLIVVAINESPEFPLVIAANRDEAYERPSLRAHRWVDAPQVIGGRDVTHGGSWLAISCDGRFAAVTNLRGAMTKEKSRGLLVRDFVLNGAPVSSPEQYAGFHLLTGEVGGPVTLTSNAIDHSIVWRDGIHALGNDPPGVITPKLTRAERAMRDVLGSKNLAEDLMRFLKTPDAFVSGERYGTRSSTVILASREHVTLIEKTWRPEGETIELSCHRTW